MPVAFPEPCFPHHFDVSCHFEKRSRDRQRAVTSATTCPRRGQVLNSTCSVQRTAGECVNRVADGRLTGCLGGIHLNSGCSSMGAVLASVDDVSGLVGGGFEGWRRWHSRLAGRFARHFGRWCRRGGWRVRLGVVERSRLGSSREQFGCVVPVCVDWYRGRLRHREGRVVRAG